MIKAKPVLKGKFWIVENNGIRVGTLSKNEDKSYMYSCETGTEFFNTERQLNQFLGKISWDKKNISDDKGVPDTDVHGFPTSKKPYNTMYDVKRKLPLFTKSQKSKSLYCAGYYIIRFEKGWVRSFCPKLVTCEKYDFKGPFKTEFEMRQELSNANRSS